MPAGRHYRLFKSALRGAGRSCRYRLPCLLYGAAACNGGFSAAGENGASVYLFSSDYGRDQGKELLKQRELRLSYGAQVALPDNSIVFPSPQARQEKLLRNAPAELGLIARNIKNKYDNYQHLDRGFLWKYGGTAAGMWVLDKIKQFGKLSCADDKCVGCGICAEVCPAGNITMAAGKPAFGSECVHCFGCAHWCPQNAISLGRLKPDQKTRYKHPEITPAELAVQKERKDEI